VTGNAQVPQNPTIAGELGHPHVGAWISWEIPSPNLLLPVRIPPREIAWLAFDGHKINIGLWPADNEDGDTFDEFYLEPDHPIRLTEAPEGDPA
jgi:hypothetical protein|tara:strand:- start:815 stop:1096 length:282 start_codon:yes stop_codon:yes gene_type:complete